jgi:hypothetical protein
MSLSDCQKKNCFIKALKIITFQVSDIKAKALVIKTNKDREKRAKVFKKETVEAQGEKT